MGTDRFYLFAAGRWKFPGLGLALALALALAGCGREEPPVVTAGGFGNGDPATIPAFRDRLASGRAVVQETLPTIGGGNTELIRALLSPRTIKDGKTLSTQDAAKIRKSVIRSLDKPSEKPARLFFISRSFAFRDREHPMVLVICDACGTAVLAMEANGPERRLALSPQLDLGDLAPPSPP